MTVKFKAMNQKFRKMLKISKQLSCYRLFFDIWSYYSVGTSNRCSTMNFFGIFSSQYLNPLKFIGLECIAINKAANIFSKYELHIFDLCKIENPPYFPAAENFVKLQY